MVPGLKTVFSMFCSLKNNANRNNDADEQHTPAIRRGRFTAPTADLSASCARDQMKLVKSIIGPRWLFRDLHDLVKSHYCALFSGKVLRVVLSSYYPHHSLPFEESSDVFGCLPC